MGQAASKAAESARRAAAPRAAKALQRPSRPPPPLPPSRTLDEAASEWNNRPSAPSAFSTSNPSPARPSDEYNPDRGARYAAAAEASGDAPDAVPEMPPDLLKFLNDAGPLKRTVDRERTSPKVYDALAKDEGERDRQQREANRRVRRRMPIVTALAREGGDGDADVAATAVDDGTTTERTTNFSTTDRSGQGVTGLGLTREDLFRLSQRVEKATSAEERKAKMEEEYKGVSNGNAGFDRLKEKTLFENSLKYIGVPVLREDEEGDIIGLWRHKAEDMKFGSGLKPIPKQSLRFVMFNEGEVAKGS